MRKVNIIVLVLGALQLFATTLALGKGGNPPAKTKESGATSGEGMNATQQTVDGSGDPSRFTYLRLYCTPDGNSHWDSVAVELPRIDFAPPAPPIHIGGKVTGRMVRQDGSDLVAFSG